MMRDQLKSEFSVGLEQVLVDPAFWATLLDPATAQAVAEGKYHRMLSSASVLATARKLRRRASEGLRKKAVGASKKKSRKKGSRKKKKQV